MGSPEQTWFPNENNVFHIEKKIRKEEVVDKLDDEMDAKSFESVKNVVKSKIWSTPKEKDKEVPQLVVWGNKDACEYDMRHQRRGVALIFNHVTFKRQKRRNGSEKDCEDLVAQFTALGFEVKVHTDLEYKQLRAVLESTSKEDHSDADCLIIVVMSHGDPGEIHAKDFPYRPEELWTRFTGNKCISLLGKPKLFFIQACRGNQVDDGIRVVATVTDSSLAATYTIPTQADILISYATVDGYMSWRSPNNGSWYIQALCEELALHGKTLDILTIMTFVHRRVAVDNMSQIYDVPELHMKVQMPAFTSMLTRLVYFRGKAKKAMKKLQKTRVGSDGTVVQTDELVEDEGEESYDVRMSPDRDEEPCEQQGMRTTESCPVTVHDNEMKGEQVWNREVVTRSEYPVRETIL